MQPIDSVLVSQLLLDHDERLKELVALRQEVVDLRQRVAELEEAVAQAITEEQS